MFSLSEGWQFYEVALGYRLERLAGFLPCCHAADKHERVESLFSQLQRHPGAGRFACSSTVEVNVLVLGQSLEFRRKIIGFNADGSFDALSVGVVITMAADIEYHNLVLFIGGQLARQFFDLNPWN